MVNGFCHWWRTRVTYCLWFDYRFWKRKIWSTGPRVGSRMLVMVLVYLPRGWAKESTWNLVPLPSNILPKKQWTWEWLIRLFHLTVLKKKPFTLQEMLALSPMALRMPSKVQWMLQLTDLLTATICRRCNTYVLYYGCSQRRTRCFQRKRKPDFWPLQKFHKNFQNSHWQSVFLTLFVILKVTDRISVSKKYTERRKLSSLTA